MARKNIILGKIEDQISNLLYYDRKEDEDLEVGAIEEAIQLGEITVDEMVEAFRHNLSKGLSSNG